eukprot:TRINITY_DN66785_c6_g2_i2.p1 TRINITY_DN66785_c6_g2~~TRINITY_DN66785_c6_g2_i2.p1  ORF type:complete len:747 (+),score=67.21 TRINITY_DN66785_c6_g2_i2:113-2353(+)
MAKQVVLNCTPERKDIYAHTDQELLVLAHMQAPVLSEDDVLGSGNRPPVRVSAVIDRSGSMRGTKMTLVKETMSFVIDNLKDRDELGVIAYDDYVEETAPLLHMDAEGKEATTELVNQIQSRSRTNLSGGLFGGMSQLVGEPIRSVGKSGTAMSIIPVTIGHEFVDARWILFFEDHTRQLQRAIETVSFSMTTSSESTSHGQLVIHDGIPRWHGIVPNEAIQAASDAVDTPDSNTAILPLPSVTPDAPAEKRGNKVAVKVTVKFTDSSEYLIPTKIPLQMDDLTSCSSRKASVACKTTLLPASSPPQRFLTPTAPTPPTSHPSGGAGLPSSARSTPYSVGSSESDFIPRFTLGKNTTLPLLKTFVLCHRRRYAGTVDYPYDLLGELVDYLKDATISAVWLFTDGEANVGLKKTSAIKPILEDKISNMPISCSVYTFGFGAHHDADMLQAIAKTANGSYYFIQDAQNIGQAFTDCLGGLMSVTAQDIHLSITPLNRTEITQVLCKYPTTKNKNDTTTVVMNDLFAEEQRDILFRVKIPETTTTEPFEVAKIHLVYYNTVTKCYQSCSTTVTVNKVSSKPDQTEPATDVDQQRNRYQVGEAIEQACALADRGQFDPARTLLREAITAIDASSSGKTTFCENLKSDLQECLKQMQSAVKYNTHGSKTMKTMSAAHSTQRHSGMTLSAPYVSHSLCTPNAIQTSLQTSLDSTPQSAPHHQPNPPVDPEISYGKLRTWGPPVELKQNQMGE